MIPATHCDLENDPHQLTNLSENPDNASIKAELCRTLWKLARTENDAMINPYKYIRNLAPQNTYEIGGIRKGQPLASWKAVL